jgi:hypothetical protein
MLDKENKESRGGVTVNLENDVIGPSTVAFRGEIRTWIHA